MKKKKEKEIVSYLDQAFIIEGRKVFKKNWRTAAGITK